MKLSSWFHLQFSRYEIAFFHNKSWYVNSDWKSLSDGNLISEMLITADTGGSSTSICSYKKVSPREIFTHTCVFSKCLFLRYFPFVIGVFLNFSQSFFCPFSHSLLKHFAEKMGILYKADPDPDQDLEKKRTLDL